MNYSYLLGRAWEIVRRHRFIWWLGLLAMFTEGGGFQGSFRLPNIPPTPSDREQERSSSAWPSAVRLFVPHLAPSDAPSWAGLPWDDGDFDASLRKVWAALLPFLGLVVAGAVLLFLLWLILLYFSISAQAGLILAAQALEESRVALGFSVALEQGRAFFWRLLGLNLLVGLALLLLLLALAAPIVVIVLVGHKQVGAIVGAVALGLLFVLLFIAAAWYASMLARFAARRMVLTGTGITDGLEWSHQLILSRLGTALVSWLVELAVRFAYGLAVAMVLLLVGGVLVVVGLGVYALTHVAGTVVYGILVGGVVLAALLVLGGVFTGFLSTYWTLVYRGLLGLTASGRPGPWDKPVASQPGLV